MIISYLPSAFSLSLIAKHFHHGISNHQAISGIL